MWAACLRESRYQWGEHSPIHAVSSHVEWKICPEHLKAVHDRQAVSEPQRIVVGLSYQEVGCDNADDIADEHSSQDFPNNNVPSQARKSSAG